MLRGAAEVYVVDNVADRLSKVASIGAIAIDCNSGEPCKPIKALRSKNALVRGSFRPASPSRDGPHRASS